MVDIEGWVREKLESGYDPERLKKVLESGTHDPKTVDRVLEEMDEAEINDSVGEEEPEAPNAKQGEVSERRGNDAGISTIKLLLVFFLSFFLGIILGLAARSLL
ncbi:MAG: hypothetical protein ACLFTQ_03745 [Candidatus Aenigmatarchaeota archaeon]